jgi:transcriptional regulator GlxA family with amidase domain
MRLVYARRLARCRAALDEPGQTHRSISDIAFAWGFSDMTHFGRRFTAAYGVLPREIRRGSIAFRNNPVSRRRIKASALWRIKAC